MSMTIIEDAGPRDAKEIRKMLLGSRNVWKSTCQRIVPHVLEIEPTVDCRGEDWTVQHLSFKVMAVKWVEIYVDDQKVFSVSCSIFIAVRWQFKRTVSGRHFFDERYKIYHSHSTLFATFLQLVSISLVVLHSELIHFLYFWLLLDRTFHWSWLRDLHISSNQCSHATCYTECYQWRTDVRVWRCFAASFLSFTHKCVLSKSPCGILVWPHFEYSQCLWNSKIAALLNFITIYR